MLRGAELSVHHKNVCLAVAGELLLEGEPGATGGRSPHRDDLVEVADDGAVEPRQDVEVHPHPVWNGGERGVTKDVVGERVLAEGEEHEAAPLREGWRGEIEDDRDEGANVEDAEGLRMEGSNNVDVTSAWRNVVVVGERWWGVGVVDHDATGGSSSLLEAAASVGQGELIASHVFLEAALCNSNNSLGAVRSCSLSVQGEILNMSSNCCSS